MNVFMRKGILFLFLFSFLITHTFQVYAAMTANSISQYNPFAPAINAQNNTSANQQQGQQQGTSSAKPASGTKSNSGSKAPTANNAGSAKNGVAINQPSSNPTNSSSPSNPSNSSANGMYQANGPQMSDQTKQLKNNLFGNRINTQEDDNYIKRLLAQIVTALPRAAYAMLGLQDYNQLIFSQSKGGQGPFSDDIWGAANSFYQIIENSTAYLLFIAILVWGIMILFKGTNPMARFSSREMLRGIMVYVFGMYFGSYIFQLVFTVNDLFVQWAKDGMKANGLDPDQLDLLSMFFDLSNTLNLADAFLFFIMIFSVGVLNYQYAVRLVTIIILIILFPVCAYASIFPGSQKALDLWFKEFCSQVLTQGGHAIAFAFFFVLLEKSTSVWILFAFMFSMNSLAALIRLVLGAPGAGQGLAGGSMGGGAFQAVKALTQMAGGNKMAGAVQGAGGGAGALSKGAITMGSGAGSNVVSGSGASLAQKAMNTSSMATPISAGTGATGAGVPSGSSSGSVSGVSSGGSAQQGSFNAGNTGTPQAGAFGVNAGGPGGTSGSNVKPNSQLDKQSIKSPFAPLPPSNTSMMKSEGKNLAKSAAKGALKGAGAAAYYSTAALVGGAMTGNPMSGVMAAHGIKKGVQGGMSKLSTATAPFRNATMHYMKNGTRRMFPTPPKKFNAKGFNRSGSRSANISKNGMHKLGRDYFANGRHQVQNPINADGNTNTTAPTKRFNVSAGTMKSLGGDNKPPQSQQPANAVQGTVNPLNKSGNNVIPGNQTGESSQKKTITPDNLNNTGGSSARTASVPRNQLKQLKNSSVQTIKQNQKQQPNEKSSTVSKDPRVPRLQNAPNKPLQQGTSSSARTQKDNAQPERRSRTLSRKATARLKDRRPVPNNNVISGRNIEVQKNDSPNL